MDLDHRGVQKLEGVQNGHGGVGITPGIDNDSGRLATGFLNPGDQLALMVGLTEIDAETHFTRRLFAQVTYVIERVVAVDVRLPHAQHVQVRAVEDQDVFHSAALMEAAGSLFGRDSSIVPASFANSSIW